MTVNDVVLAAVAGALRLHAERREERPRDLKAMVPVNVRSRGRRRTLGNRITFMFVELPASSPDPLDRLWRVTARPRAQGGGACRRTPTPRCRRSPYAPRHGAEGARAHALAQPARLQPRRLQHPRPADADVPARLPAARGALRSVPLSERHALSIGMTTIGDDACFGLYADPETLPDADALALDLHAALDELLATA